RWSKRATTRSSPCSPRSSSTTSPSRPAGARHRRGMRDDLAGTGTVGHRLRSAPVRRHHEQRPAVLAPEHAREAELVQLNAFHDFAALADTHTALLRARPDRAIGVDADAVGAAFQLR